MKEIALNLTYGALGMVALTVIVLCLAFVHTIIRTIKENKK